MNTAPLERFYDSRVRQISAIESVAIGIVAVSKTQRHLTIIYRTDSEGDKHKVLELAYHHDVRSSRPKGCFWAAPRIDTEVASNLGRLCAMIAKKYAGRPRSIPYGLRYDGSSIFDGGGNFVAGKGVGLTCATFVIAVFGSYGVPLVKLEEWTPRDEDVEWQDRMLADLANRYAESDPVYVESVKQERECVRYRPEEVAAAGTALDLPVGFAFAEETGRVIVRRLLGDAPEAPPQQPVANPQSDPLAPSGPDRMPGVAPQHDGGRS